MGYFLGIDLCYTDIPLEKFEGLGKTKSQHLTLYFWEELLEKDLIEICNNLEKFEEKKFEVVASEIYCFPNKTTPELLALQFDTVDKLVNLRSNLLDFLCLEKGDIFEPHITLIRKLKLASNFKEKKELLRKIEPIKIEITNISLYRRKNSGVLNDYEILKKIKLIG